MMNKLKMLFDTNSETVVTMTVMLIIIGWFSVMYFITLNFMDAMTLTIVPLALGSIGWIFIVDMLEG